MVTDVVEVARYATRVEADLARLYLQSRDIEALLFDTEINNVYGSFLMPIRLMVLDEDLGEARKLLRDYRP